MSTDLSRFWEEYRRSIEDPEGFWSAVAEKLYWREKWKVTLDSSRPPFYRWFVGGRTNITYNALDRHVAEGRGSKAALIWVSGDGSYRVLTYRDLWRETNRLAAVLKRLGVKPGDRVVIYMPMIPEAMIAMLAVERIGAIHSVVFSGFSAQALADRINDARATFVITTDGMYRRGRVIPLKPNVDEALKHVPYDVTVLVYRRVGIDVQMRDGRDYWWHEEIAKTPVNTYVEPEWVPSEQPLFILYTSGTTGKPKGITHLHGQYMVWVYYAFAHLTGAWSGREVVFFSTADIGWISGHHYSTHGPLLNGLTVVWYEDAPDYPHPGIWWEIVDMFGVTHILFAPTAIRLLIRYGEEWPAKYRLDTLRTVISTGEVLNEEAYRWMVKNLCRGRENCHVIDIWGQTETACFVTAPGSELLGGWRYKYGSVGLPYPGLKLAVYDDSGNRLPPGQKGNVVVEPPVPPAWMYTIWGDDERYVKTYWSRFPGVYLTGDYGMVDEEGYLYIMGRSDDVIKIAGHRLSTREVEDVITSHPAVAEAAVIGMPDPVRGEVLGIFVVPKAGAKVSAEEVASIVREKLGPVAVIGGIFIVEKLPKTRTGKVMRRVLRAVATGQPLGDLTTLEDEASVEEVRRAYEELKRQLGGS